MRFEASHGEKVKLFRELSQPRYYANCNFASGVQRKTRDRKSRSCPARNNFISRCDTFVPGESQFRTSDEIPSGVGPSVIRRLAIPRLIASSLPRASCFTAGIYRSQTITMRA